MGVNPSSDGRLQDLMQEEVLTPELALTELENQRKKQEMLSSDANAKNPYNDPNRSTAKVVE